VTLSLEDAVSYEGSDYVVRGVLDYFGGGRRWRVYQLHDGKQEAWLEVRGEGAHVAWLSRAAGAVRLDGESLSYSGVEYRVDDRGAAAVSIQSAAGRQEGVLVEYRRLTADSSVMTIEEWPDGQRALVGRTIDRDELELWTKPPATE
jgi:hypothetical protein